MSYYEQDTKRIEQLACDLFNQIGIKCFLNNLESITDVDIKTENDFKIDVQFSKNFDRYGDYRLDIISAYKSDSLGQAGYLNQNKPIYKYDANLRFIENFDKKFNVKTTKPGKIFQNGYLDALIIFFYNGSVIHKDDSNLNKILIIRKDDLINFLKNNKEFLFEKIKLNNKQGNGLADVHGSAFIPINAEYLVKQTGCIFTTLNDFLSEGPNIQKYLFSNRLS
ncbi:MULTISPECIES: hypothetical protein [Glaesserella]|uniref:Uncharacterized protein n=1 Tax=Glaesserella australis TaxID=2094024 RepID=A0A328BZH4_9PAST|nr:MULTISPECIES: hypothetical protein [Glaesserella]AUI65725.1 hypothetical protein CJD39_03650 [Glaesserella sp. 15-184]RAL18991.1 hypothetical protein C5N92_05000 [Glaesserella australis]